MPRTHATGLLSLGMVGSLMACGEPQRISVHPPRGAVESVTLRGDVGIVEVVAGREVRVVQELQAPEGAFERTQRLEGGHLQIDVRCKSPIFCSVDTRARIPEGVPVVIEMDRGEIWATGVGDVDIELGSGTLDLEVTGPLRARVGQGKARVEAAAHQLVRVTVGQGDIELVVPRAPWRVDVQAGETQLLGVERRREARGSLELIAPAGRVEVRATGVPMDSGSPRLP